MSVLMKTYGKSGRRKMNKYQEALDDLSYPDSSSPCYGCKCGKSDCGDCNIKKDILTLKELVDKATPKKVVIEEYLPVVCPHYGNKLSISLGDGYYEVPKSRITNYCKDCGGRLDWSEEK